MYKLYKDPNGDRITMEEKASNIRKSTDNIDYSNDAYMEKVETLNSEIIQLKNDIQQVAK